MMGNTGSIRPVSHENPFPKSGKWKATKNKHGKSPEEIQASRDQWQAVKDIRAGKLVGENIGPRRTNLKDKIQRETGLDDLTDAGPNLGVRDPVGAYNPDDVAAHQAQHATNVAEAKAEHDDAHKQSVATARQAHNDAHAQNVAAAKAAGQPAPKKPPFVAPARPDFEPPEMEDMAGPHLPAVPPVPTDAEGRRQLHYSVSEQQRWDASGPQTAGPRPFQAPAKTGSTAKDLFNTGRERIAAKGRALQHEYENPPHPRVEGSTEPRTMGEHFKHGFMGRSSPYGGRLEVSRDQSGNIAASQDLGGGYKRVYHRTGEEDPSVREAHGEHVAYLHEVAAGVEHSLMMDPQPSPLAQAAHQLAKHEANVAHVEHASRWSSESAQDFAQQGHDRYWARQPKSPKPSVTAAPAAAPPVQQDQDPGFALPNIGPPSQPAVSLHEQMAHGAKVQAAHHAATMAGVAAGAAKNDQRFSQLHAKEQRLSAKADALHQEHADRFGQDSADRYRMAGHRQAWNQAPNKFQGP